MTMVASVANYLQRMNDIVMDGYVEHMIPMTKASSNFTHSGHPNAQFMLSMLILFVHAIV